LNVSKVDISEKGGAFPGVVYVEGVVRGIRDKRRWKILPLIIVILIFPITIIWFILAARSLAKFVVASDRLGINVTLEGEMYTGAAAKEHGLGVGDEAISERSPSSVSGSTEAQSADRATVVSDIRISVTGRIGFPNGGYGVREDHSKSQAKASEYVTQIEKAMQSQWSSLVDSMLADG